MNTTLGWETIDSCDNDKHVDGLWFIFPLGADNGVPWLYSKCYLAVLCDILLWWLYKLGFCSPRTRSFATVGKDLELAIDIWETLKPIIKECQWSLTERSGIQWYIVMVAFYSISDSALMQIETRRRTRLLVLCVCATLNPSKRWEYCLAVMNSILNVWINGWG